MKKKPTNTTEKREFIEKIRPILSYEYRIRNRNLADIGKQYGLHKSTIRNAKDCFTVKDITNLYGGKESVLIVPKKNIGEAVNVLREMGIDVRFPSVDHTLEERYQSKINLK